jgi:hypothetical protein
MRNTTMAMAKAGIKDFIGTTAATDGATRAIDATTIAVSAK